MLLETAQPPLDTALEEAAVAALYQQMMDGWNQASAAAFAAPFADVSDFIAFDGTHFRGRAEIERAHEPLFATHLKGMRLVGRIERVQFLSADVALMHAIGSTVLRGKSTPAPERDSTQTLVATRSDGGWQLVAFQNTRVRPIDRSAAGTLIWLLSDWLWKICCGHSPRSARKERA